MSDSPDAAPVRKRRFEWIRAASDRVPTRWLAGIATALFLVATAAFGGLATAAPPELAQLEPGEPHITDQRSFTVQRAVLIDELSEVGVSVEEGERVLALIVDIENRWDEPIRAADATGLTDSFVVAGIDPDNRTEAARYDDGTGLPWLQPGVPGTVVFGWAVDDDTFTGGDDLTVTLNDMSLYTGSFVTEGRWWDDPVADAVVTVEIEDLGTGADDEE